MRSGHDEAQRLRRALILLGSGALLSMIAVGAITLMTGSLRLLAVFVLCGLGAILAVVAWALVPRADQGGVIAAIIMALWASMGILVALPTLYPATLLGAITAAVFMLPSERPGPRTAVVAVAAVVGLLAVQVALLDVPVTPLETLAASIVIAVTFLASLLIVRDVRLVVHARHQTMMALMTERTVARAKQREAHQQEEARQAMGAQIRHDLLPPLRAIEWIASEATWPADRERTLRNALQHIRARLRDLDALPSGDWRPHAETFRLQDAVQGAVDVGRAAGQEMQIFTRVPDRLVHGDRVRLEQVLLNLVENAMRHAERQIQVLVFDEDGFEFHVVDDGPGLEGNGSGLFERGVQGKNKGSQGLGLAFAKEILERNGGVIVAEDREEGGAAFCFSWPLRRIDASTDVLVIDDEPFWRELTMDQLAEHGVRAVAVETLADASHIEAHVALVDLQLGAEDGRRAPEVLDCPCYVFSGDDVDLPGFVGRVQKPLTPGGLEAVLHHVSARV